MFNFNNTLNQSFSKTNLYTILDKINLKSIVVQNIKNYQWAFIPQVPPNTLNKHLKYELLGKQLMAFHVMNLLLSKDTTQTETISSLHTEWLSSFQLSKMSKELELPNYLCLDISSENNGGRQNDNLHVKLIRSFIGAAYSDQISESNGFLVTQKIIYALCTKYPFQNDKKKPIQNNKDVLIKYFQKQYHVNPSFSLSVTGPSHSPTYTAAVYNVSNLIIGKGVGHTKKEAEINAATSALNYYPNLV